MNGNKGLFAPWLERTNDLRLVSQLKNFDVTSAMVVDKSTYSDGVAKLRKGVVSAICKISDITLDSTRGALGRFNYGGEDGFAIEIVEAGVRQVAVIHKEKLYAAKLVNKNLAPYVFKEGHETGVLLYAALLYYEMFQKEKEFIENMTAAQEVLKKGLDDTNLTFFINRCAVVGENLYRRLCCEPPKINVKPLTDTGGLNKLASLTVNNGKYRPTRIDKGVFRILDDGSASFLETAPEVDAATGQNAPAPGIETTEPPPVKRFNDRAFTEEELRLIPRIDPWYIMPKEVPEICNLIKETTSTYKPKRNFMLRGPSSTGKTSMSRAIAAELGLPYVYMTCSADTESHNFLGQPMYDGDGQVKFVESDFIRAIKNGWLVEIQEPLTIMKQGVLTALNGLMDDSNGITLSTGEFVQRHRDCVVIFTTNVSYVGCKKPNQSVLRRMNNVYDIGMPSEKDICARVKAVTGFTNDGIIRKMVDTCTKINRYCREEAIDDGVCGVSEIIDWVMTARVIQDIIRAAETTIISKATDDEDAQTHIQGLVESAFSSTDFEAVVKIEEEALTF